MLSNLFYRDARLLILTLFVIIVAGLSAFSVLPRQEDPSLVDRYALILTRWPGADAERVEALVTEKLEETLQEVDEIHKLTSDSRASISVIEIEIAETVPSAKIPGLWSEIRNKIDDAAPFLPDDAFEPEFNEYEVKAASLIAAVTWNADTPVVYSVLRRRAEQLEQQLRTLGGTSEVELFGEPDEQVRVEIDPDRLSALGLSVPQVAAALQSADAKVPAGRLHHPTNELLVEVTGELDSLDRVREVPLQSGAESQFITIGDVAQVTRTIAEPASDLAIISGKPAIALVARMKDEERIDQWAVTARAAVDEFRATLPPELGLELVFDQSAYVAERLNGLAFNLGLAMLAVLIVIFVMMGWRSAIPVGIALPLTCLMVLAGLSYLGIPLHQMSVTGLIIALGLLIDNAIVISDEVRQQAAAGKAPAEAISDSVKHLVIPLFGSTLTTVLAFLPIVLMPGGAGEFVGSIGTSVILAICSSLFLSLTVLPAVAGRLLPKRERSAPVASRRAPVANQQPGVFQFYTRTLDYVFARPALGLMLGVALPVIGFWQFQHIPEQFFPPTDRKQFHVEFRLHPHAALNNTLATIENATKVIEQQDRVESVHWFVGTAAPRFYYNMQSGQDDSAFYAQAMVNLDSAMNTGEVINAVQRKLDEAFPGSMVLAHQLEQGPPFDAPVEVRVFGPDLDVLQNLGEQIRAKLTTIEHVTHTRATLGEDRAKLMFNVDDLSSRLAGLGNAELAGQLLGYLDGYEGGSLIEATEELPVRVRLADRDRREFDQLASLDFTTAGNETSDLLRLVPVSALGEFELTPERSLIRHEKGSRVNAVFGYLTAGTLPSQALGPLQAWLDSDDFQVPPGYRFEIGGEAAERDRAVANLMASVSVLGIVMVATLVLTFHSFRMMALLAVIAMLASGLALAALRLFGYPFGFMAIVGTMGLIGVAINDSIVVLAAIRANPQARAGSRAAVRDEVYRATRHVMATTVTTVVGFTPLLLGGGGFWPPLAVCIAGGVLGATLLALYFAPSAYILLMCPKGDCAEADDAEPRNANPSIDSAVTAPAIAS